MQDDADETLMIAYGAGDMAAFETLYARYRGPLYRYFTRQVSEPATANDLYQGCWEKVIAARRKYSDKAPFKAWLFRIAHNHLVDHYRAVRPASELPEDTPGEEIDPGDDIDAQHLDQRLRDAIAALPDEQKQALLLRLESGLGLEDIARITGVGTETAKSRLRYATAKLKQVMQE
jgi:RNA polymerase sigma-70 factor (ECF subfamily)